MSLANGRPYLAIPGPSVIPDRVLQAMHQGSPNIYEGPLIAMVETLWPDLRLQASEIRARPSVLAQKKGRLASALLRKQPKLIT